MPSPTAKQMFSTAKMVAASLYQITVTDPWYKEKGGNWQEPTLANQGSSMGGLFAAINARRTEGGSLTGGLRSMTSNQRGRQVISMPREEWLRQGQRTIAARHGVCTDCAAAAAFEFTRQVSDDIEYRLDIVSSGTHAFAIVNREAAINDPGNWGDDAFGIDVWMQNQYPPGDVAGAFWVADLCHPVSQFIADNAARLSIDASLRDVIQALI